MFAVHPPNAAANQPCRAAGVEPSFLLHPLDFLTAESCPALRFFPAMDAARIQRVLAQGAPVPVAWYWASNGDPQNTGAFRTTPSTPAVEAAAREEEDAHVLADELHHVGLAGVAALRRRPARKA